MQPSSERLQTELARLLRNYSRALRRTPGTALSRGEFNVLAVLKRRGPLRSRELAEAEGADASTMSRRLTSMGERGLVSRVPDASDGRAQLVQHTEVGLDAFRLELDRRLGLITEHVTQWEADDVGRLAELLGRLNDSFDNHPGAHID